MINYSEKKNRKRHTKTRKKHICNRPGKPYKDTRKRKMQAKRINRLA